MIVAITGILSSVSVPHRTRSTRLADTMAL